MSLKGVRRGAARREAAYDLVAAQLGRFDYPHVAEFTKSRAIHDSDAARTLNQARDRLFRSISETHRPAA